MFDEDVHSPAEGLLGFLTGDIVVGNIGRVPLPADGRPGSTPRVDASPIIP